MKTICAEQARANIIAAYTRQHEEAVSALSSAMERVRNIRTAKIKSQIDSKPTLADLLLAGREE
jgi:hypothetical protein